MRFGGLKGGNQLGIGGPDFENLEDKELGEFLTTTWAILGDRCRLLMENEDCVPEETIAYTLKIIKEAWEVP